MISSNGFQVTIMTLRHVTHSCATFMRHVARISVASHAVLHAPICVSHQQLLLSWSLSDGSCCATNDLAN